MSKVVLLDAGPLGMVTHPRKNPDIKAWLQDLLRFNTLVCIPEIADYEVRRELLRSHKMQGISRLDTLLSIAEYVPINTDIMRKAADLWAIARNQGYPTADVKALDADVILAATAIILSEQDGDEVIIATSNVRHIGRFTTAQIWTEIKTS
jgi:toxin FitB